MGRLATPYLACRAKPHSAAPSLTSPRLACHVSPRRTGLARRSSRYLFAASRVRSSIAKSTLRSAAIMSLMSDNAARTSSVLSTCGGVRRYFSAAKPIMQRDRKEMNSMPQPRAMIPVSTHEKPCCEKGLSIRTTTAHATPTAATKPVQIPMSSATDRAFEYAFVSLLDTESPL